MRAYLQGLTGVAALLGLGLFCDSGPSAAEKVTGSTASADDGHARPLSVNRLIHSNDPYLLLHAHNPVDWYPWGPEALERAKRENKLIFISVGYSTCYWCHVAERTIYSNPEIAALMNKWFINIKVNREQRPDLDEIYMLATRLMTGQGGWPNNVFLTPDLKPVFAGSYFPPEDDALGRPGFPTVLQTIHEAWATRQPDVIASADKVFRIMQQSLQEQPGAAGVSPAPAAWLKRAREVWLQRADPAHGGFPSGEMKFPRQPVLKMFLAAYRASRSAEDLLVLTQALDAMALGGLYDQLGGGFHRYSTESTWSIPHFEKMLYDNAQLLLIYVEAYELTRSPLYRHIAMDLRDYLVRQMVAPGGGFYTAEDATVGGKEGVSYLWTRQEIDSILGATAARRFFGMYMLAPMPEQSGEAVLDNMEHGVLRIDPGLLKTTSGPDHRFVTMLGELAPLRQKLLAARNLRPQPMRDEKLIVALNGLAIEAFVRSGQVLRRPEDITVARSAAERIWKLAYDPKSGQLKHEFFRDRAQINGYLDDYALLGRALLSLSSATGESIWQDRAAQLADAIRKRFQRRDGSLRTVIGDTSLPFAPRDNGDDVYPSGTSAAIDLFQRLAEVSNDKKYATSADRALRHLGSRLQHEPEEWPFLLAAINANAARLAAKQDESSPVPAAATLMTSLSTASHVRLTAEIRGAGGRNQLIVTLHIGNGYHVNANPASLDYLIPTSISIEGFDRPDVSYPKPIRFRPEFAREGLDVYEGTVAIIVSIPKEALKNRKSIRATVTTQACTDQICLPPSILPFTVNLP